MPESASTPQTPGAPPSRPAPTLIGESGETTHWLDSAYSEQDIRDEWDWLFEDGGELDKVWFRLRWTTPRELADEDELYVLFGDHEVNGVSTEIVYEQAKPGSPGAYLYLTTEGP